MRDVTPVLKAIGFADSETKTYLAALESGPRTVIDLTKLTELSRQAVYLAIESLTRRGLMTSMLRGKKKFFAAEPPDTLLAYARRKEDELKSNLLKLEQAIPELTLAAHGEKPTVKVYEGKEGILAMMEELKHTTSHEIHEIADLDTLYKVLPYEDLKPYKEQAAKKGFKLYALYAGGPVLTSIQDSQIFKLPSAMSNFKAGFAIYATGSALISFEGKTHCVLIESKAIADTLRILIKLAGQACQQTSTPTS